jgi:hypothetical protein
MSGLIIAADAGHSGVVECLLEHRADVNFLWVRATPAAPHASAHPHGTVAILHCPTHVLYAPKDENKRQMAEHAGEFVDGAALRATNGLLTGHTGGWSSFRPYTPHLGIHAYCLFANTPLASL